MCTHGDFVFDLWVDLATTASEPHRSRGTWFEVREFGPPGPDEVNRNLCLVTGLIR